MKTAVFGFLSVSVLFDFGVEFGVSFLPPAGFVCYFCLFVFLFVLSDVFFVSVPVGVIVFVCWLF